MEFDYHGARVEIALNEHSSPPSLVAVHLVRQGFRLPFIGARDQFSTDYFHLRSGRDHDWYFFHFSFEAQECQSWQLIPGLNLLVSGPPRSTSSQGRKLEDRTVVHGIRVDLRVFQVARDEGEFLFEFGSDNLKDVPVTLFCEGARANGDADS